MKEDDKVADAIINQTLGTACGKACGIFLGFGAGLGTAIAYSPALIKALSPAVGRAGAISLTVLIDLIGIPSAAATGGCFLACLCFAVHCKKTPDTHVSQNTNGLFALNSVKSGDHESLLTDITIEPRRPVPSMSL